MIFRDLEKVRAMLKEATELDISYAYDDLVFPDHTAFIIQYAAENNSGFYVYFHTDCLPEAKTEILENLQKTFLKHRCSLIPKGAFNLKQKDKEVEISFS